MIIPFYPELSTSSLVRYEYKYMNNHIRNIEAYVVLCRMEIIRW